VGLKVQGGPLSMAGGHFLVATLPSCFYVQGCNAPHGGRGKQKVPCSTACISSAAQELSSQPVPCMKGFSHHHNGCHMAAFLAACSTHQARTLHVPGGVKYHMFEHISALQCTTMWPGTCMALLLPMCQSTHTDHEHAACRYVCAFAD
jgi:hypothetical protein